MIETTLTIYKDDPIEYKVYKTDTELVYLKLPQK